MNEELDDSEYYHQDFTTASEWEVFIARLEEVIHEWKRDRNKVEPSDTNWSVQTERITFADVEFTFTYYKKCEEISEEEVIKHPMEKAFDFDLKCASNKEIEFCINSWFGLREFYLLAPVNNVINSEGKIKVLLSSIHIAALNSNCSTPIFIQIKEYWQKFFLGVYEGGGIRTNFEMVHLSKGPQHCQYLSGLLDMFKTKISSPVSLDPVIVAVQLTYILNDFGSHVWRQELSDPESEHFDPNSTCSLPFGVPLDPISSIHFKASWSKLPEHLIVDTESYSDFNPMDAPKWSIQPQTIDSCICFLSDCLYEFLQVYSNTMSVYDVLGDFAASQTSTDVTNPLDLLTEPKVPTIGSVLKRAARSSLSKSRKGTAPLSEEVFVPMLYFLFPDAEDVASFPYAEKGAENYEAVVQDDNSLNLEKLCQGFKTCTADSLVWRISIIMAQCLYSLGGIRAFSHIWFEFAQEMRYRWEKSISIPGLESGFPDPRTCLLNQKLQMLNCCMERKRNREMAATVSAGFESAEESSTDDEEFFDCNDAGDDSNKKKHKHSLWNQPVGRLGKFDNLKLLQTGEQMYIPATQEPVPKTEDQLEEDTDVLLKLGSDAQGSELRARMMSASLLSDMESFKAANPGAILEDFIRWYSPRDWIEEEGEDEWGQSKGHLSSRMLIEDNTWVQIWESAKPVPAHRQKRLFDDTREAEKVLHFLDSRTLGQIVEMLIPVLSQAAIYTLVDEWQQVKQELPDALKQINQLIKTAERLSREGVPSTRRFEKFSQDVFELEFQLSKTRSILYKFNPQGEQDDRVTAVAADLAAGNEVLVRPEGLGGRMLDMFMEAQKKASLIPGEEDYDINKNIFPQVSEREFVMRVSAARPASYSAKCPQFLRAVLSKGEFRLIGAFSEDIVFF